MAGDGERPEVRVLLAGYDPICSENSFSEWLGRHGIDPKATFRCDVGDQYFVAHRYRLDVHGAKFVWQEGPNKGEVALDTPVLVEIREPMPELEEGKRQAGARAYRP